jgi:hypothetical protein
LPWRRRRGIKEATTFRGERESAMSHEQSTTEEPAPEPDGPDEESQPESPERHDPPRTPPSEKPYDDPLHRGPHFI